jgi:hypothetical protein
MPGAAAATALKIAAAPVSVVPAKRNASAAVSATLRAGPERSSLDASMWPRS